MTSGQLCAFFYADLREGLFECKKCGRRKQAPGTGYSILLGRLGTKHTGNVQQYAELEAAAALTMDMFCNEPTLCPLLRLTR
ncbi:hypothetical protein PI125_g22439 [Phytophthora idaei]|nr:hypothetical protein PI125_g22439 [Phytophthora idaei]